MLRTTLSVLIALSAFSLHAMDPGQRMAAQMRQQQMMDRLMAPIGPDHPTRMRVYLKNGPKNPPLDSFRLEQGKPEIWRFEREDAVFRKGGKIAHRLADLDSIVLEDSSKGFPAPNNKEMLFLQQAGAVNHYALWPKAEGMPAYLRKGDGEILPTSTRTIRGLVADDPEALGLIERYSQRWYWRGGIMVAGAALMGTGLALAKATEEEDENGERKPSTIVPGIIVATGLVAVVVPATPILNFIWKPLPRRSLDTYNRNRAAAP